MAIRSFSTPGVVIQEIDQSDVLSPVSTSVGGIVIRSTKGVINKPVLITSEKELIDNFGKPVFTSGASNVTGIQASTLPSIPDLGYSWYAASKFLEESNNLYVARAIDSSDKYAAVAIDTSSYDYTSQAVMSAAANISAAGIYCTPYVAGNQFDTGDNITSLELSGAAANIIPNGDLTIASIMPGTDGNNLAISVEQFSSACNWFFTYDDYPISGSVDYSTNSSTQLIAKQVVRVDVYVKDSTQNWNTIIGSIAQKQSATSQTSAYDLRQLLPPTETFYGSLTSLLDGNGNQLLLSNIVNGNSNYIYVKISTGASFGTTLATSTNIGTLKSFDLIPLGGGTASLKAALGDVTGSNVLEAWDIFASREKLPNVNILLAADWNTLVKQKVALIAATRQDCIAVCQAGDLDDTTVVNIKSQEAYGYSNPSYVALYAGFNKIYDQYNDRFLYVPKAIFGASIMARTDRVASVWVAPAGLTRGTINSYGEKIQFTESEIGQLYDRNINTSKNIIGTGSVIFGQKTAQMKKSALDRINVRRDLLFIENSIANLLVQFLFEINNERTRQRISSIIGNFLADVLAGGGLEEYSIICDSTNNTPIVIDNNQLIVSIFVKPPKVIEFITLQTVLQSTGVSITEIV